MGCDDWLSARARWERQSFVAGGKSLQSKIRTSEPDGRLSAEDTVRIYKSLPQVESVFRKIKNLVCWFVPSTTTRRSVT